MMMKKITAILSVLWGACAFSMPIHDSIRLELNKSDGQYATDDTVRVFAIVNEVPDDTVWMRIVRNNDLGNPVSDNELKLKEGRNLILEKTYDEAQSVIITLHVPGDEVNAGFLIAPETFRPGFDKPDDLEEFWRREIRRMRQIKMNPEKEEVPSGVDGIKACSVTVNCPGPRPVRGYVAYPENAGKGSLPIIVFLHAAGKGPGTQSHVNVAAYYASLGALAIDVNAHGFLNGEPDEYYNALFDGELKDYALREPVSKDNYYFKWMFLRAQRAVDYLTQDPLWDGKRIIVTGTSQGGAQSAFLAGVDKRVTHAAMVVPGMMDQGGSIAGHACAWPATMNKYPDSSISVSPYFDPALLIGNTRAKIWCEVGLFDPLCPATGILAGMNQVKTEKRILTVQRGHGLDSVTSRGHGPVDKEMELFIRDAVAKNVTGKNAGKLDKGKLRSKIGDSQNARIDTHGIIGSQVIVYQNGKEIMNECFGSKGVGLEPLGGNELYRIASMTKPVTGLALLLEQERGNLNIYDDVADYLPEFSEMYLKDGSKAENKIKIYQLVTHSSGIPDVKIGSKSFTLDSALTYLAKQPLDFDPGTGNRYSTGAFDLAAKIIEKTSGMEFGEYLETNIFDKLGMNDTGFEPDGSQWDRMVAVFSKKDDGSYGNLPENRECVFGSFPTCYHAAGAALASTAEDYMKFAMMLAGGGKLRGHKRVIGEKALRQYHAVLDGNGGLKWGMGVRVIDCDDNVLPRGSYGWSGYYGSHFWIDPVNKIVAVYMRNQDFAGGAGADAANELERDVMSSFQ